MSKQIHNSTVPAAAQRLKLCWALKDCGENDIAMCLRHSVAKEVFVYDDNSLGYSTWSESEDVNKNKCFIVHNPKQLVVVLLPIDNRIVTFDAVKRGGVADCALLTETELAFVEFKTNTYSTEYIEDYDAWAIEQLWHTYSGIIEPRCRAKGVNVDQIVSVEFYIVYDSELDATSEAAAREELMVRFYEQHNKPLFFDNEKEFQ